MRKIQLDDGRRRRPWLGGLCGALVFALAGGAAAAEPAARMTAISGGTTVGDRAAGPLGEVAEGEAVETADDAGCAMLLDEDALLELCGKTQMSLDRDEPQGPRIVRVDAGEARVSVPDAFGAERIEVHTPAAIATLLGTSLHVKVDPATGDTIISCLDNEVRIQSSDASLSDAVICSNGEEVLVREGQAPEKLGRLEPQALKELEGCLVDFHHLALQVDRARGRNRALLDIASGDLIDGLPGVGEGPFDPFSVVDGGDDLDDPLDTVTDAVQSEEVQAIRPTLINE